MTHREAVSEQSSVCEARRAVRQLAATAGLTDPDVERASLVASEIASNLAKHATDGELLSLKVTRRLIVQLDSDGEYRVCDCEHEAQKVGRDDFAGFRGVVALARWNQASGAGKRRRAA